MPGIHRQRRSIRLQDYDYTRPGAYFVSICTYNLECLLGEIKEGVMRLNEYGRIVREQWKSTERIRPCIKMDTYIVMPNHLHGIVIMNDIRRRDTARRVPTAEQFGKPVTGSLPTVVGSFKSAVTKHVNILHNTPGAPFWQHRYYEHIVRNENDLNNIREYIITNPARWAFDKENPGSKKLN